MTLQIIEHPTEKTHVLFVGVNNITIGKKTYETTHDFLDEDEQLQILKYFKVNKPHLWRIVE